MGRSPGPAAGRGRRALGWSLSRSIQTTLPLAALNRAIAARPPAPGLVHHSDRGSQYASNDYVSRLEDCKITISMSRPARPWENAKCERFMRTLKEEEIDCRQYRTLEELERNVEDFIERFYNQVRLHAALGYRSPVEFEQRQIEIEPKPELSGLPAALSFRRHQEIYPDAVSKTPQGRRRC